MISFRGRGRRCGARRIRSAPPAGRPRKAVVDEGIGLGDADALGEEPEALSGVARRRAPTRVACGVVPTVDVLFLDQLDQLALGRDDVG